MVIPTGRDLTGSKWLYSAVLTLRTIARCTRLLYPADECRPISKAPNWRLSLQRQGQMLKTEDMFTRIVAHYANAGCASP